MTNDYSPPGSGLAALLLLGVLLVPFTSSSSKPNSVSRPSSGPRPSYISQLVSGEKA